MFEYLVELTGLPSDPESDWTLAELLEWRPLSEAAAWAPVGEVLDAAERLMPDEELVAVLKHLRTRSLEPADHVRILRLWERHVSWSAAQQQHWLAAIGGAAAEPEEWADEEVGASLRLSAAAGGKRLYVARMLARRFSIAHASLETGDITWLHALALAEETRHIDDDAARRVERIVMPHAHRQTVGVFRHAVKRAVLAADSEGAAQRHARARAGRSVRFTPLPDGMALIEATMPAPEAMTVWQGLDLLDRRGKRDTPGDVRGRDARLSDALFGVFAGILGDADMPRTHGRPFAVGATADLATLFGLADNPGHLDGYGAIPAAMVRELAANTEWKLLATDALSGQVSSVARSGIARARVSRNF
ncbi:MAG: hypothetical protein QOF57_1716 [Frankiaceae bacterium]|nr:hypothetical protein [Frankiaceae bacterium]